MNITDLQPDNKNTNKGTKRGRDAVRKSLQSYGAGRSVLIDRDGRLIAGNKTAEQAMAAGIDDLIVVQTDGTKLVAVQRTDLSLDDPTARALAIADNRVGELGLEWDPVALGQLATDLNLQPFFAPHELADLLGDKQVNANDVSAEYTGMPDYTSEDQTGVRRLIVHFATHEDVTAFARLINQTISDKTKFVWFPEVQNADLASYKYE